MPVSLPSNFGRKLASCLDPPDLRPGLPQQGENERESEHVGGVPVSVCVREREKESELLVHRHREAPCARWGKKPPVGSERAGFHKCGDQRCLVSIPRQQDHASGSPVGQATLHYAQR